MKMIMITYNHAIDDEVIEMIKKVNVSGYTKIEGATGEGSGEPHLGTNTWPSTNNVIFTAVTEKQMKDIKTAGREIKEKFPKEGMSFFALGMTEMKI